jgi:phosphonate transport system permease protein
MDPFQQIADMFNRMWPPDQSYYPDTIHAALMETLHIATLGTLFAVIFAIPVGVMVAENVTPIKPLNWLARFILVSSRSINSLVWALLFVAIFGPGPLAGALAIAFRSIGFIGKLFGEALEETNKGPIEALQATGASKLSIMLMGYWPQVLPTFWSILLFRWDINIRESAVLGLVGAGGIGVALSTALELFYWDRVAMVLISMLVVVAAVELLVTQIRKRII